MTRLIRHTKDSLALTHFAQRHANQWHSYKQDKRTQRAVERALFLQAIEVNEYNQFRATTNKEDRMPYTIENGLIIGPEPGRCAGYIFNFMGHGSYDPTGKIMIGELELTQAQVDAHNHVLGQAEVQAMVEQGKGLFYLSWDQPDCTPANPRWKQENRGEWYNRNYRVANWCGSFKSPSVAVKRGHSYGFGRFETHWVWFTGPDGQLWYGVRKGDGQVFRGKRLKTQSQKR